MLGILEPQAPAAVGIAELESHQLWSQPAALGHQKRTDKASSQVRAIDRRRGESLPGTAIGEGSETPVLARPRHSTQGENPGVGGRQVHRPIRTGRHLGCGAAGLGHAEAEDDEESEKSLELGPHGEEN
jgi:hypothetical protein